MLREIEYDPVTGETSKWYIKDDGSVTIERSVDLTALIDSCKQQANAFTDFNNKRTKFHKVASIPPIVVTEILKKYNLDVFSTDENDKKRLERIIETDYPVLKTHAAKLWRPVSAK